MKKHISYPKIGQFRNVISDIQKNCTFVGLDENNKPIYDSTRQAPIIRFRGTTKIHGTNAAVCYNDESGMWVQSRKRIITPEDDNAGFAFFAYTNQDWFKVLLDEIVLKYNIDTRIQTVSIYGEWAGGSIQKGVAMNQLTKMFYIFGIKISDLNDDDSSAYWVDSSFLRSDSWNIYHVDQFGVHYIDIDFNNPGLSQNKLIHLTVAVEEQCPVGKYFDVDGTGEGIVWVGEYKGSEYRFKVKGEKHSSSNVKTLVAVDPEKAKSINDFIDYAVTQNRFDQAMENVFGINGEPDIKGLGNLIKWMTGDIIKEEIDVMVSSNIEPKQINKQVVGKTKTMFFEVYK